MRFVQFYFGLPLAMVILSATAVPIFHRAKVYTAYEYLEQRFDSKTRALVSAIFLMQRGLAAGHLSYAPAVVLSVVLGWPDRVTTLVMGGLVMSLHDARRNQGRDVGGRTADGRHHRRADDVADNRHRPAAGRCFVPRRGHGRGRSGKAERGDLQLRLERSLQRLERADRRHVPGARLFWDGPEPSAAIPDRQIDRPEPS